MKAEEAAKWMDMLCERSLKMDESGKFDQVAALIRAQAKVVEAAEVGVSCAACCEICRENISGALAAAWRAELEGK